LKKLLIVYASQTGHTARLAEAIMLGASRVAELLEVRLLRAFDAGIDDLLSADGLLIGTPENFGYMSGAIKDFFDRTYYPAREKVAGLPYALFVSAGNDGSGAIQAIERIARGYGFNRVMEPLLVKGELTQASLQAAEILGETMASGVAYGIF